MGTSWTIAGTGDFNGDGKKRHPVAQHQWRCGDLAHERRPGPGRNLRLGNVGTSWTIAGTGDFNGDGYSDILWRNTNGAVSIWFMTYQNSTADLVAAPLLLSLFESSSWTVAETGDFNADKKSDILWRNSNGDLAIWFMNVLKISTNPDIGNVGLS